MRTFAASSIAILLTAALAAQTPAPQPGRGRGIAFTEPSPLDFNDHEGYVSLFDGVSLKGWDGNPKLWRVENGAIVGESTSPDFLTSRSRPRRRCPSEACGSRS